VTAQKKLEVGFGWNLFAITHTAEKYTPTSKTSTVPLMKALCIGSSIPRLSFNITDSGPTRISENTPHRYDTYAVKGG